MFNKFLVYFLLCFSVNVFSYSSYGQVGYWDFNEGVGNKVADKSNGTLKNPGIAYNTTWVDGIQGKALCFNGKSSYVDIVDNGTLDFSCDFGTSFYAPEDCRENSLSISAWIYILPGNFSSTAPIYQSIVQNGDSYRMILTSLPNINDRGDPVSSGLCLHGIDLRDRILPKEYSQGTPANKFFKTNQWYHVGITWQYPSNSSFDCYLYINGVKISAIEIANTTHRLLISKYNLRIGNQGAPPWGESNWFNGYIDEVRIYKWSIGSEEMISIYNQYKSVANKLNKINQNKNLILNDNYSEMFSLNGKSMGKSTKVNNGCYIARGIKNQQFIKLIKN